MFELLQEFFVSSNLPRTRSAFISDLSEFLYFLSLSVILYLSISKGNDINFFKYTILFEVLSLVIISLLFSFDRNKGPKSKYFVDDFTSKNASIISIVSIFAFLAYAYFLEINLFSLESLAALVFPALHFFITIFLSKNLSEKTVFRTDTKIFFTIVSILLILFLLKSFELTPSIVSQILLYSVLLFVFLLFFYGSIRILLKVRKLFDLIFGENYGRFVAGLSLILMFSACIVSFVLPFYILSAAFSGLQELMLLLIFLYATIFSFPTPIKLTSIIPKA